MKKLNMTQVISQVVGPSFLLGAVAGFISILSGRMTSVLDRIRWLNAIGEETHVRASVSILHA